MNTTFIKRKQLPSNVRFFAASNFTGLTIVNDQKNKKYAIEGWLL
jgi:hypothetical protein